METRNLLPPEVHVIVQVSIALGVFFLNGKIMHQTSKILILPARGIADPHLNKETEGSYQLLERKQNVTLQQHSLS